MRARPSDASQRPSEGLTKLPNVERPEASPGSVGTARHGSSGSMRERARNAFDSLAQIVAPLLPRPVHLAPTGRIPSHRNASIFRSKGVGLGPRNGPLLGKVVRKTACPFLSLSLEQHVPVEDLPSKCQQSQSIRRVSDSLGQLLRRAWC